MSNLNKLTKDLTKEAPRSPGARFGKWAYMARMIDKGRATIAGKSGEYHLACPAEGAAHAAILAGSDHEGKSYQLYGDPAVSFRDVTDIISKLSGKPVPYTQIADEAFLEMARAAGFPDGIGQLAIRWIKSMHSGEWAPSGNDLEKLLGRKPTNTEDAIRTTYLQPAAAA